jgi:hypothetical protein
MQMNIRAVLGIYMYDQQSIRKMLRRIDQAQ